MFTVHVAVGPANRSGAAMNERSDRAGDASRLPFNRRTAMRVAGAAGLAGLVATVLSGNELAVAGTSDAVPLGTFSPLRPPATPLAVRSMYLSTWQPADNLAGT